MFQATSQAAFLVAALGVSVAISAQAPTAPTNESSFVFLRYETFNPLQGEPEIPATLQSRESDRLFIVQFHGTPQQADRDAIAALGGEVHGYLPDNSYVVRMPGSRRDAVMAQTGVRWVGAYHPAYRIDPEILEVLADGDLGAARYNMVVVDKHNDKPALAAGIQGIGGIVDNEHTGSLLFTATLTAEQLVQTAHFDQVLWIDAWGAPENDVDNARAQSGANYVETQGGYTGNGINLHIYEGILQSHQAFSGPVVNVNSGGQSTGHGTNTAGIVFGDGTGNPQFRGYSPDSGKFYTNYSSVSTSRWQVVSDLINVHNVSHTTASWGDPRTRNYTSVSAEADDIIFDHDIAWTQSQSNAGNQDSRPQAWAKNIFSCGGFGHGNNANPQDDSWQAGNGSTGPAADGRIKPTLAAYYDQIGTTSSNGGYTTNFGGTSGATPIIAGNNALAIDMFTDDSAMPGFGIFGNQLRNPGASKHVNRPHFTTLKCLQVANASQYPFNATSSDNRREHVGWGYPSLERMHDYRDKTFIVDETDILTNGNTMVYSVFVAPGETRFSAVLHYAEPGANPAATITLINNLSLRITAPDSTTYWGNNGLEQGNWSVPGGSEDGINPIECVFVQNPTPGAWTIEVIATSIVQDNHVETAAVDADFGLVVTGGTGQPPTNAFFTTFGVACAGSSSTTSPCVEVNGSGGTLTGLTSNKEFGIIPAQAQADIERFEVFLQSTGGTVSVPAAIYPLLSPTPIATTTITVGPNAAFYEADFGAPVALAGAVFLGVDTSAGNVFVPNLATGNSGAVFSRPNATGSWTFDPSVNRPSYRVYCTAGTVFDVPELGNTGLPILGTSYDITLSNALPSTAAFAVTGLSDQTFNGQSLPAPLPGAPGCDLQVSADATRLVFVDANGAASVSTPVPSNTSFIGVVLFHQWAIADPTKNALGIVVSNSGRAFLGN